MRKNIVLPMLAGLVLSGVVFAETLASVVPLLQPFVDSDSK